MTTCYIDTTTAAIVAALDDVHHSMAREIIQACGQFDLDVVASRVEGGALMLEFEPTASDDPIRWPVPLPAVAGGESCG